MSMQYNNINVIIFAQKFERDNIKYNQKPEVSSGVYISNVN